MLSYSVPTLNSYSAHGISTRLSEMIAMPIRMNGDTDNNDDDTASGSSNTNTTTMATTTTSTTTTKKKQTTKFYAIHIGPSKTGTSTIQADSAHHNLDILEQDHTIYVGRTWEVFRLDPNLAKKNRTINGTSVTAQEEEGEAYYRANICMKQKLQEYYNYTRANSTGIPMDVAIDRLENDETTRTSLRRTFINDCWTEKYRYMLEYSHIDSNEEYSYTNPMNPDPTQVGTQLKIYDILGYDRVLVIGAYRRYAEWLTSTYNQLTKVSCLVTDDTTQSPLMTKQCPNIWSDYIWPYIKPKNKNGGYSAQNYNQLDTTLPNARRSGPSKIEVKVLNYFQLPKNNTVHYNTITTELYCDALGMDLTPNMCNFSRERGGQQEQRTQQQQRQQQNNHHHNNSNNNNHNNSEELVTNKGSPENVAYQHIVETARRLALIIPTNEQLEANEKVRSDCKKQDVHVWCESLNRCIHPRKCKKNRKAPIGELGTITVHGTNTCNTSHENTRIELETEFTIVVPTQTRIGSTVEQIIGVRRIGPAQVLCHTPWKRGAYTIVLG